MIGSSLRILLIATTLVSCASIPADNARINACVDREQQSLFISIKNASSRNFTIARDQPHLGCCAINEMSIYLVEKNGKQMKRCAFVDRFAPPVTMDFGPNQEIKYTLSVDSLKALYCGVSLESLNVVAAFTAKNEGKVSTPLFGTNLIEASCSIE